MTQTVKPLPISNLDEILRLSGESKTWLQWKERPRYYFKSDREWRRWNVRYASKDAGCIIKSKSAKPYFQIYINGKQYLAHRIVIAITTKSDLGQRCIDHIDGNGLNNNPTNLRIATQAENMRNSGAYANNTSGKKGVRWHKKTKKWEARVQIDGVLRYLGLFPDIESASAAYEAAAREHFGEFYRAPANINNPSCDSCQ